MALARLHTKIELTYFQIFENDCSRSGHVEELSRATQSQTYLRCADHWYVAKY